MSSKTTAKPQLYINLPYAHIIYTQTHTHTRTVQYTDIQTHLPTKSNTVCQPGNLASTVPKPFSQVRFISFSPSLASVGLFSLSFILSLHTFHGAYVSAFELVGAAEPLDVRSQCSPPKASLRLDSDKY